MDYEAILAQVLDLLQREKRLSYRVLKRRLGVDDDELEDLKEDLIYAKQLAMDEDGRVLVWAGSTTAASPPAPPARTSDQAPLAYTPAHLTEKILATRTALEGERKQVTVLFADIKDSTELIHDLDPEAAQQLLDPALHCMMDAVHRYEGTVNQVLGDGIMALFGAPLAHEDHALRACYAALAMQTAMRNYTEEVRRAHGLEMRIRVGLNSGEVVVRAIGNDLHMDYSAVGQSTHLAARMEQLATPGSIRLTAATLRLVEGLVRVNTLGPVPVRGMAELVEVCELVGASAIRRRLQAAVARGLTRFVGRQTEVEVLQQALARAEAGHGQVIAIVGEAGVGKSRLVYECVHAHRLKVWLVLESASVSYGKATPYFPVIDLLKRYVHIEESDDLRAVRAKVTGQVLTLDEALHDALPVLLALLDAAPEDSPFRQLEPSQRRQRTLEALKRVLLRESQVQPLVLVFEDLHWIDAETQALLDSLVESLPTARLLLLVNYRPEYQHGWGSKTYYTQLRLDPLPPASVDAFLHALLGDDPSLRPLTSLLIARTEGNPFFLEESVRTLIETGVLVGETGAYRLAQAQPTIQVPTTVQAVLAARIDRLPPEAKRLLQTAAVIGSEVPLPLLEAIAELPKVVLHGGLAHLQAAEFLYETCLFPEREYTFKHALTHEVAYGSLLLERRRGLHARLVEALERLVPDRLTEQIERLAHHALRGEVWDKAVLYCQQAGTRAHHCAAYHEAVTAFEHALQAFVHLPEDHDNQGLAITLRLALVGSLAVLGEFGRRLTLLREAEVLARVRDDRPRLVEALARIGQVHRQAGDNDSAMTVGQEALELAAGLGHSTAQVLAAYFLGQTYYDIGNFSQAAALQRWNVEAADREASTPSHIRGQARARLARTLGTLGAFEEGQRHGEEALRLAMAIGRGQLLILAYASLGRLYLTQGSLAYAIRILDQGLALCRASNSRIDVQGIATDLGAAYVLQGCLAEGRALLGEGMRDTSPDARQSPLLVAWLSEVCRLEGHGEKAWQHARRALDLAGEQKARGDEAHALHQLGVVHAHADPPDVAQAEAHYRQALALAEELGMRPLQAHCHRVFGTLYTQTGQREQARAALTAAIDLYRAMDMTFWLPQAEATLAQVSG